MVDVAELVSQQAELLRRLKLAYGVEQSAFDAQLGPLIDRFARYVHLLPATPANYFRAPAGLLRMSLEVAFYSVQGVDSTLFQGLKSISQRQHLEPRWRLATFIAGLCAELHRPLGQVVVTSDRGLEWPPYLGPLYDWAVAHSASRYHLRWVENQQESRATGLFALPHIVSAQTMQYLADGNSLVVTHMLASITGAPVYRGTSNVLDSLVRRAVALVVDTELRSNAEFYGQHRLAVHLERYLVDALRRLVAAGDWTVNGQNSPVWHGADGVFLLWPRAGEDVVRLLERDQLTGIPKNPETILELLVASRVVASDGGAQGPLVQIRPPGYAQPAGAVRLSSESIVTSAMPARVEALATALIVQPTDAPGTAHAPPMPERSAVQQDLPIEQRAEGPQAAALPTESEPSASVTREPEPTKLHALVLLPAARLKPVVHAALSEIVANCARGSSAAEAELTPEALFVPLAAFLRRGLDTALVVDALDSAGLLHRTSPSAKTARATFAGESCVGVLVKGSHIAGFAARSRQPA